MLNYTANNKKLITLTIYLVAGNASIIPPVGPLLTQYGVNSITFCKEFNEKTYMFKNFFYNINDKYNNNKFFNDFLFVVEIDIFDNKNYNIKLKKPTTSYLLHIFKKKHEKYRTNYLDLKTLILLAKFKFPELSLNSSSLMIKGTARAMRIEIINNLLNV